MCHPQKCAHVSQNLTLSHETEPLGGFIAGTYVQLLELVSLCTAVVFVSNGGALSLSRGQLKRRKLGRRSIWNSWKRAGTQVSPPPVLMMCCPDLTKPIPFIAELSAHLGWESEMLEEEPGRVGPASVSLAATPYPQPSVISLKISSNAHELPDAPSWPLDINVVVQLLLHFPCLNWKHIRKGISRNVIQPSQVMHYKATTRVVTRWQVHDCFQQCCLY